MKKISITILACLYFVVFRAQSQSLSSSGSGTTCGDAVGQIIFNPNGCGCGPYMWQEGTISQDGFNTFTVTAQYSGGFSINYNIKAPGKKTYRVVYYNGSGAQVTTTPFQVTALEKPTGVLSASPTQFLNSGAGQLVLTNLNGAVQWNGPAVNGNFNVTETTGFSANITNGVCSVTSNTVQIEVFKTGVLTGESTTATDGTKVLLALSFNYGGVIQWEYSVDAGATWKAFDYNSYGKTVANDRFADTHEIWTDTKFRVKTNLGPFGTGYTNTFDVAYVPFSQSYLNSNPTNGGNYVRQQQVTVAGITDPNAVNNLLVTEKREVITYLDGKGRSVQTNVKKGSPGQSDVITPAVYDRQGRQTVGYLPYVSYMGDGAYRSNQLNEQLAYYANGTTDKVTDSPYPYAVSVFEKSPLGKLLEQGGTGLQWQPGQGHTNRLVYSNNVASDEVRQFNTDGTSTKFYDPNELAMVQTIDADQKNTQKFMDKAGRIILSRVQLDESINGSPVILWLQTYYIYNESGALKYMISPKGVDALKANAWVLSQTILDQYTYQFVYDNRGRPVEKKVPGQAWAYFCYDRLDRLVLAQDGNIRTQNPYKWLYIKYDRKGRVVQQGLFTTTTTTRGALQQNVIDPLYALDTDVYYEDNASTNMSFPTTNTEVHVRNYYDGYGPVASYATQGLPGEGIPSPTAMSLLTWSEQLILGTSTWLSTGYVYDADGRVLQIQSRNHLQPSNYDLTTLVYDFEGKVKIKKTYHNAGAGKITTVINKYDYDHMGRVTNVYQNNNAAPADQLVARYEYNELGQLVDKKLHNTSGTSFLQSVDYRYDIQGKLTSINNAQLTNDLLTNDDTNDMFGLELLYHNIESGLNSGANEAYYNGNISAVKWKGAGATSGAADQKSYKFSYDKSDRLSDATSQLYNGATWTKEAGALNESLTYDQNGNIQSLVRNQRKYQFTGGLASYTNETIDNLTYNYNAALGDQLQKVTDAASGTAAAGFNNGSSGTSDDYGYDANGNLMADLNKGISNIAYNHLGMPTTITFSDGRHVDYVYDAVGTKLTVKTYNTSNVLQTTTDYANGFVYENSTLSFFSSPEGRVVNNNGTLEYQYAISDHQGNTRVVFSSVNPTTPPVTATFENPADDIQKGFLNIQTSSMYWVSKSGANNTSSGQYVTRMNNTYSTGPAKSVSVFPGDIVNLEVWSYFEGGNGFGASNQSLNTLITSVAGAFGGVAGAGEAGQIYNHVSNAYGIFGSPANAGDGAPTAHLNYILFDRDYNPIDMGWKPVPATANMSKQLISFNPITIKEAGFMYVYLSYGGDGTNWVYFDDLKITHTKTNIIQYNEYYPFGLQANTSWTRDNAKGNKFLYNDGSEINTTTGWYDLSYRNYDATIGRFMQVDPFATKYASFSAYHYSYNNPVMFNDPSGADPDDLRANPRMPVPDYWGYGGWTSGSGDDYGQYFAQESRRAIYEQATSWAAIKSEILERNAYTTVTVNGISTQMKFASMDEVTGLVGIALSNPLNTMSMMRSGGYITFLMSYRDADGNPCMEADGISHFVTGIYLDGTKEKRSRSRENLNIEDAVSALNDNAEDKSVGYCAKYVRTALEAGGMNTEGRPGSAKNYGPFLYKKGFYGINTKYYTPIKGDLVVFQAPSVNHPHGHIQMYNGAQWISDFKQNGFWPGSTYRKNQTQYSIFRWE